MVNKKEVYQEFNLKINNPISKKYDCIVLAVPHKKILNNFNKYSKLLSSKESFVFDIKYSLNDKKLNVIYL